MRLGTEQKRAFAYNTGLLLLAVAIAVGFRVSAFFYSEQTFSVEPPALSLLNLKVPFFSIGYSIGLNVLLAVCFVLLFQRKTTKFLLLRTRSLLPLFFALILSNLNPNIADANLNYILSLGLMFVYFRIFECYEYDAENLPLKVFDLSAWMGFLCLLDIRLVCLMPVFWYMLFAYRAFSARVLMASLFGLGTAFGLLLIYLIVTGQEISSMFPIFREMTEIDRQLYSPRTIARMVYLGTIFVTCFISYLNLRNNADKVRVRVIMGSLRVALICTNMLSVMLFPSSELLLAATIVPMVLLLGYLFSSVTGLWHKTLFILFVSAVVATFVFRLWSY